jgi:hypothetical protein
MLQGRPPFSGCRRQQRTTHLPSPRIRWAGSTTADMARPRQGNAAERRERGGRNRRWVVVVRPHLGPALKLGGAGCAEGTAADRRDSRIRDSGLRTAECAFDLSVHAGAPALQFGSCAATITTFMCWASPQRSYDGNSGIRPGGRTTLRRPGVGSFVWFRPVRGRSVYQLGPGGVSNRPLKTIPHRAGSLAFGANPIAASHHTAGAGRRADPESAGSSKRTRATAGYRSSAAARHDHYAIGRR